MYRRTLRPLAAVPSPYTDTLKPLSAAREPTPILLTALKVVPAPAAPPVVADVEPLEPATADEAANEPEDVVVSFGTGETPLERAVREHCED